MIALRIFIIATFIVSAAARAEESAGTGAPKNIATKYTKKEIADSRFGVGEKEEFMRLAHGVAKELNKKILGQENTTLILQDRLIQYIESYPNRKGEPVAINLIGLPGIGKTGMLKALEDVGLPVVIFNAQDYVGERGRGFKEELFVGLSRHGGLSATPDGKFKVDKPLIIVIDELDKVPEIDGNQVETTQALVGAVNAILSEGELSAYGTSIDVSNVMFVTTMNFSTKDIESFTSEILDKGKNYYELTIEDFQKFDEWVRNQPSARFRVLSKMFRSNTVSRLAPNTVILQPLSRDVYRRIIELVIAETTQKAGQKSIGVSYDPSLVEFLLNNAVFAPSGARETIFRARAILEQLVNFGVKAIDPKGDSTVDRPRELALSVVGSKAVVRVTPVVNKMGEMHKRMSFEIEAQYDAGAKLFIAPTQLESTKPVYPEPKSQEKQISKKEVVAARYPLTAEIPPQVAAKINSVLIGQEETVNLILDDMKKYLGRPGPAAKEPSARILSGFPGIGKSELARLVGANLNLPIVKINMQQFSSDSAETVTDFLAYLNGKINEAKAAASEQKNGGKYILLLEELDKVFEIDPQTGRFVNRPIMALIKDLLNDGQIAASLGHGANVQIDIRDAFALVTMNFSVDRFGFEADPRLTSIGDVMNAWRSLNGTPMALKQLLSSMFLPETVSRLMSRFTIMKPLEAADYKRLIANQIDNVVKSRLLDPKGRNVAKLDVKLTGAYENYLYQETVIPSEGGRYTVVSVQNKIASDLEAAMQNIPRKKGIEAAPLLITLDYDKANSQVVIRMALNKDPSVAAQNEEEILRRDVIEQFPSPEIDGKIPAFRLFVSAHEFGHAYMGMRLGLPIEHVVVVSPSPGTGGYVKFAGDSNSGRDLIFNVFSALASRAFERIVMSPNPTDEKSVLQITSGPSADIRQATYQMYLAIYELGLDPQGGTIDSNFNLGSGRYASIDLMPKELADQIGRLMREMENFMVADFLKLHPQQWYVQKILELARKGHMTGNGFADLVGFNLDSSRSAASDVTDHFRKLFGEHILEPSISASNSSSAKASAAETLTTIKANRDAYLHEFTKLLKNNLHPGKADSCASLLKGA